MKKKLSASALAAKQALKDKQAKTVQTSRKQEEI